MDKRHFILAIAAATAPIIPSHHVIAQDQLSAEAEAVFNAAVYVLEQESAKQAFRASATRILVDEEFAFGAPSSKERLPDNLRSVAQRLADKLGARRGHLEEVLVCNPVRTNEDMPQNSRCQLTAGTQLVLQISPPEINGDQMYVWVGWWGQATNRTGVEGGVYGRGHKVLLTRGIDGAWTPARIVLHSSGHLGLP